MAGRFSNLEFNEEPREEPQLKLSAEREHSLDDDAAAGAITQAMHAYRNGRFEQALRLYTRCLQIDRRIIPAWVGQVQMLVQLGEYHEGRVWADKALELFRNNGELLAAKAQACIRLNDFAGGYECSDASLQLTGSSAWRWQVRGELLLSNRKDQYEMCFTKAVAEPRADWFDHVVIGRIFAYYHRAANAISYLKKALELEPGHAYTWFELGECQASLAMSAAAASSYERALEIDPGLREARTAQSEIESTSALSWLSGLWRRWSRR